MDNITNEENLSVVQQWFYTSISHPAGVVTGAAEAAAHLQMEGGHIPQLINPSTTLTAAERLAIYHNAYYLRLMGVLEAEYPALKLALGDKLFSNFAQFYLQQNPSTSFTLYQLSANLPGFLRATVPQENASEGWPDFIIDLARLERMFQEIYRGPGTEGKPIASLEAIKAYGEGWDALVLQPVPCLKLMQSSFPVHHFLMAARSKTDMPLPEPSPTYLAVCRNSYHVKIHELTAVQYSILEKLLEGKTMGDAGITSIDEVAGWMEGGFFVAASN